MGLLCSQSPPAFVKAKQNVMREDGTAHYHAMGSQSGSFTQAVVFLLVICFSTSKVDT